ncbi:MAG: hypothetical protein JRF33_17505 [Deltaproteobacteria bacterium]|nr:hypothetical protein [Deltaproteobacteria bacterium]
MAVWTILGWVVLTLAMMGVGVVVGGALVVWYQRGRWMGSLKYVMDRLKKLEADLRRVDEDMLVVRARLSQRGLMDDEDSDELRRILVELPRQRKAERLELVEVARRHGLAERVVSDTPDTLQ